MSDLITRPPRTPDEILAGITAGTARRRYILSHEAFYASSRPTPDLGQTGREISVGLQLLTDGRDDGCPAEFRITEYRFAQDRGPAHWQVAAFDDAWVMFAVEPRLFEGLATLGEDATIKQIVDLLDRLGYADATEREDPR